jgi:excinuclease UvrABC helicase subunit UvrB
MRKAASELRYEEAALLRDEIAEMRLVLAEEAVGFAFGTPVVDG